MFFVSFAGLVLVLGLGLGLGLTVSVRVSVRVRVRANVYAKLHTRGRTEVRDCFALFHAS